MSWEANHNMGALILRLKERIQKAQPDSPELRAALTRIGVLVSSQAAINVRRRGLIDTGRLINSIRYEFFKENNVHGVKIGSFGVPYAAIHEFGYKGLVNIRRHTRQTPFGKVSVKAHERFMRIPKRPYLTPAVRKHQNTITDVLREALKVG